jgi:hypothetical protein
LDTKKVQEDKNRELIAAYNECAEAEGTNNAVPRKYKNTERRNISTLSKKEDKSCKLSQRP